MNNDWYYQQEKNKDGDKQKLIFWQGSMAMLISTEYYTFKRDNQIKGTEDPPHNDSVCYLRFCCKFEFAVIKKLDRTHLKHQ